MSLSSLDSSRATSCSRSRVLRGGVVPALEPSTPVLATTGGRVQSSIAAHAASTALNPVTSRAIAATSIARGSQPQGVSSKPPDMVRR